MSWEPYSLSAILERRIVITKDGKPVAKDVPIESGCAHLIGVLKGKIRVQGDVFSTGLEWDAGKRIARHVKGWKSDQPSR
jgi:antitoxin (DNA-binding transcriptional repressor) of toxin-antitoxin stability system